MSIPGGGPERPQRYKLPKAWQTAAIDVLRGRGLTVDEYKKTLKERFLNALAVPFIDDLCAYAEQEHNLDATEREARLALTRSTAKRRLKRKILPHANKFFGILVLSFGRNLEVFGASGLCPVNHVALARAIRLTLSLIRQKEFDDDFMDLPKECFSFVEEFIWYPGSEIFLTDHNAAKGTEGNGIIADVVEIVQEWHSKLKNYNADQLVNVITTWTKPYSLYWIGIEDIRESINDATE